MCKEQEVGRGIWGPLFYHTPFLASRCCCWSPTLPTVPLLLPPLFASGDAIPSSSPFPLTFSSHPFPETQRAPPIFLIHLYISATTGREQQPSHPLPTHPLLSLSLFLRRCLPLCPPSSVAFPFLGASGAGDKHFSTNFVVLYGLLPILYINGGKGAGGGSGIMPLLASPSAGLSRSWNTHGGNNSKIPTIAGLFFLLAKFNWCREREDHLQKKSRLS